MYNEYKHWFEDALEKLKKENVMNYYATKLNFIHGTYICREDSNTLNLN